MEIKNISSNRKIHKEVYWEIVYEWENIMSDKLNVPVRFINIITECADKIILILSHVALFEKILMCIDLLQASKEKKIIFEMFPRKHFSFLRGENYIPVIIDFTKNIDIDRFNIVYKNSSLVLITSLEAFIYLKKNDCKVKIEHFPLSIPDKFIRNLESVNIERKDIDVVLVGRKNPVLWQYLLEFEKKYSIVYVYSCSDFKNKDLYYSNKHEFFGRYTKREDFFNLVKRAKVSFYSTSGIDDERLKHHLNHVTPRLFELLSVGCRIIGRYPTNSEVAFFNIDNTICYNVQNYDEFEAIMIEYLNCKSKDYTSIYEKFLLDNITSKRVIELKKLLSKIN